ncbi:hypothetical protein ACFWCA_02590 [Streptomyces phaeochromogenes]|uniref:hypothetical protein n=1 Tax=Streptomyces phaeochromogenes TaxID=1923 RepID=UPI0036C6109A
MDAGHGVDGIVGLLLEARSMTGRVTLWDSTVEHRAGVLRNVFPAPLGDYPEAVSALAVTYVPDASYRRVCGG